MDCPNGCTDDQDRPQTMGEGVFDGHQAYVCPRCGYHEASADRV